MYVQRRTATSLVSRSNERQSASRLEAGDIELLGGLPNASNSTLLGTLTGDSKMRVVYKPILGESPLWDFPYATLALREAAAFELSDRAGFGFVPCTVIRGGPFGLGSVQRFVEHDPSLTAFELEESHSLQMRRVAVFDLIVNNGDRKGGHVLKDPEGSLWAIDHGVCFHPQPKLRTVLWSWVGMDFAGDERELLDRVCKELQGDLGEVLASYLSPLQLRAMSARVERLLSEGKFPAPGPGRHYPWPPV